MLVLVSFPSRIICAFIWRLPGFCASRSEVVDFDGDSAAALGSTGGDGDRIDWGRCVVFAVTPVRRRRRR